MFRIYPKNKAWSVASILLMVILSVVVLQSILFGAALLSGGVLVSAREYADQIFAERVTNRLQYLQGEMQNRWSRIELQARQVGAQPFLKNHHTASPEALHDFWRSTFPFLREILQATGASDVFIILKNNDPTTENAHKALYLRRTDPTLNGSEIMLLAGCSELVGKENLVLSNLWTEDLVLDAQAKKVLDKPLSLVGSHEKSQRLAYWSPSVSLQHKAPPAVTYSMPLIDAQGVGQGVIGIGIQENYLVTLLPSRELSSMDSLGYFIGYKPSAHEPMYPMLHGSTTLRTLFESGALPIRPIDESRAAFRLATDGQDSVLGTASLINPNTSGINSNYSNKRIAVPESVLACVRRLPLYPYQTPFDEEQWYLVGLTKEVNLYSFADKIKMLMVISLVAAIAFGGICAAFVSRRMTTPIVNLAQHVAESDFSTNVSFERTGFAEIDHLTSTIETANSNALESTARMLRIIDMTNVSMEVFEVKNTMAQVFATDGLKALLELSDDEATALYAEKARFMEKIQCLMANPEPEEEDVYELDSNPEKWIKIRLVQDKNSSIGVMTDVTPEILKKRSIRHERDYDTLTGLCSRRFFQHKAKVLMGAPQTASPETPQGALLEASQAVSLEALQAVSPQAPQAASREASQASVEILAESLMNASLDVAAMLMLDLDKFKRVNDTYGHQCGDEYLIAVAKAMEIFPPEHSITGRRSGDEFFVFIFHMPDQAAVRALVQNFYAELARNPFEFPDGTRKVMGLSMGLAWYNGHEEYDTLLQHADDALYQTKHTVRGTVSEYVPVMKPGSMAD